MANNIPQTGEIDLDKLSTEELLQLVEKGKAPSPDEVEELLQAVEANTQQSPTPEETEELLRSVETSTQQAPTPEETEELLRSVETSTPSFNFIRTPPVAVMYSDKNPYSDKRWRAVDAAVVEADDDREKILSAILKNEKIREEVKKMKEAGASQLETEVYKNKQGYEDGSTLGAIFGTAQRLAKTESTFPFDIKAALEGKKDTISPLKLLGTAVGAVVGDVPLSEVGWTEKDVPERVKDILSRPLVDAAGNIDIEAVSYSNLPRQHQNEMFIKHASQQTGVPEHVWREVLTSRGGILSADSNAKTTVKRLGRVIDEIAFNLGSKANVEMGNADKTIEAFKELSSPVFPITITWKDNQAFANGIPADSVSKGMSEQEQEKAAWEDLLDHFKSQAESQAMENWQMLPSLAVPYGGALKAAGKLGKLKGLEKVGRVAENALNVPGKVAIKFAPGIMAKVAKANETHPLIAKAITEATLGLSRVGTQSVLSATGAPEGMAAEAGVAGGLLGASGLALEAGVGGVRVLGQKEAVRAIMRTEDFEQLPSYVKRHVLKSAKDIPYKEYRKNVLNQIEVDKEVGTTLAKVKAGLLPPETVTTLMETGAEDPRVQGFLDMVAESLHPDGPTPRGLTNMEYTKKVVEEAVDTVKEEMTITNLRKAGRDLQSAKKAVTKSLKEGYKEIPISIYNDSDKLLALFRGEEVDGFKIAEAEYLAESLQNVLSTESPLLPYKRFMIDVIKVMSAVEDASDAKRFSDLMQYVANPPAVATKIMDGVEAARTPKSVVFDTDVERINPLASATNLLNDEGGVGIKDIVKTGIGDIQFYMREKAKLSQKDYTARDLQNLKRDSQHALRKQRIQMSLDKEFVGREVQSLSNSQISLLDELMRGYKVQKKDGTSVAVPSLMSELRLLSLKDISINDKQLLNQLIPELERGKKVGGDVLAKVEDSNVKRALQRNNKLVDEFKRVTTLKQDAELRLGKIEEKAVKSRAYDLKKEALYSLPKESESIIRSFFTSTIDDVDGLTDSNFYLNLVNKVGKEAQESLEKTGAVQLSSETLGYLGLLQNFNFVQDVLRPESVWQARHGTFKAQLGNVLDSLFTFSGDGMEFVERRKVIREYIDKRPGNVAGMGRVLSQMRQAFNVSKMQREIDKYAFDMFALAEKYDVGESLSKGEVKNLVRFMQSDVVTRYRLAKDPSWIVTRAKDAEDIFETLKYASTNVLSVMKEHFVSVMGRDANDLTAAFLTSQVVNAQNLFDGNGYLSAALVLSKYWKRGEADPTAISRLSEWANEESTASIISKETAFAIASDVSELAIGVQKGKAKGSKLTQDFFDDLDKLVVRGKKYVDYQDSKPFQYVLKKQIIGLDGIEERLVLNEEVTPFGVAFREFLQGGQTEAAANRAAERLKGKIDGATVRDIDAEVTRARDALVRYWKTPELTLDAYEMALEFIKTYQKHDKRKLEAWNEVNTALNKKDGSRVAPLLYQPARLETRASKVRNVSFDQTQYDRLSTMDVMYGRHIKTSERGQNNKAAVNKNIDDLMHPQELFMTSTNELFEALYSRTPRRRLWEKGLLMQQSGYQAYASGLAKAFLGSQPLASVPNTRQALTDLFNKVPGFRHVKSFEPIINSNWILVSLRASGVNALQNAQMQALNVSQAKSAFKSLVQFVPGYIGQMWNRAVRGKDKAEVLALATNVPSPEYAQVNSQIIQALNTPVNSRLRREVSRINWEVSPFWKKVHKANSKASDPIFEFAYDVIKESSEAVAYRSVAGQAANFWEAGLLAARGEQEFGARVQAVRKVIAGPLGGVSGSNADIMTHAINIARASMGDNKLAGYETFAATYIHQSLSRYDPKNLPRLVKALDQMIPGSGQFFNPATGAFYRALLAGRNLTTSKGRTGGSVGLALGTISAFLGFSALWSWASQETGIDAFEKISPMPGSMMLGKSGSMTDPGTVKGGDMQTRFYLDTAKTVFDLWLDDLQATRDGTTDLQEYRLRQNKRYEKLLDTMLQMGPLAIAGLFKDIVYSPAKLGWAYWGEETEVFDSLQAMADKDELDLTTSPIFGVGPGQGGETVEMWASLKGILSSVTPIIEREDIKDTYSGEDILALLAKEGAIPLSALYKIRERDREKRQSKLDLLSTVETGTGVGEFKQKPTDEEEEEDLDPFAEFDKQ